MPPTVVQELLKQATARLDLSAGAHGRVLKVARTIAGLAASTAAKRTHVTEVIRYRRPDSER